MAIEQGLFQLVTSDTNVCQALAVDPPPANNSCFWIQAPKGGKLPFIVLSRVATGDTYTMNGATGFRDGLFQANCFATSYYQARSISLVVRQLLESFAGNLPDVNQTAVDAVFTEKDFDLQYEEGGKNWVYQAVYQFRVWYYETALTVGPGPNQELDIDDVGLPQFDSGN
jgi:hypothetical protein